MSIPRCSYCGHEVLIVPPVQLNGEVVPGRVLFEDCPRCRDMFAMAALSSVWDAKLKALLLDAPGVSTETFAIDVAKEAYEMADALLKAREK